MRFSTARPSIASPHFVPNDFARQRRRRNRRRRHRRRRSPITWRAKERALRYSTMQMLHRRRAHPGQARAACAVNGATHANGRLRWQPLHAGLRSRASCKHRPDSAAAAIFTSSSMKRTSTSCARASSESAMPAFSIEYIEQSVLRKLAAALAPSVIAAAYTPGDGQADPRATTSAFASAAVRAGATFNRTYVDGIALDGRRVAGVSRKRHDARGRDHRPRSRFVERPPCAHARP